MKAFPLILAIPLAGYSLLTILSENFVSGEGPWEGFFRKTLILNDDLIVERAYGRLWAGRLDGPDGAVETFRGALIRDPASPYRWCDLGEALLEAGEAPQVQYCFRRGVELGGSTPSIRMRAANFHFRLGENEPALVHTSRVLGLTADFDPAVFSSYTRFGVPLEAVLARGLPGGKRAAQSFFRYLLGQGPPDALEATWRWITTQSFADDRLADEYAAYLLGRRDYEAALRVWAAQAAARDEGYPVRNSLFNAGFEHAPAGQTFDWRISRAEGVQAERDAAVAHSGSWSLRVRFEGRDNVAYQHVAQRAVVRPGPWRLEAQVRTEGITTDQGIGFQIVDAEEPSRLDVKTTRLSGTHDWTRIEKRFMAPGQTKLVEVRVVREPSLKFDNKISGTAWIDDVRLTQGGR